MMKQIGKVISDHTFPILKIIISLKIGQRILLIYTMLFYLGDEKTRAHNSKIILNEVSQ